MQSDSSIPSKTCTKCGAALPATVEYFQAGKRYRNGLRPWCRSCGNAYQRAWSVGHIASVHDSQAKWRVAHRGYQRLRDATRYTDAEQREKLLAQRRERHARCRKQELIYARAYRARHPEQFVAYNHRRRALRAGAPGTHTATDIAAQRTRQKGLCFWCGEKTGRRYHVDHVVPLALGGSDGPENIVISCGHCNMSKGAKHPMEWAGVLC